MGAIMGDHVKAKTDTGSTYTQFSGSNSPSDLPLAELAEEISKIGRKVLDSFCRMIPGCSRSYPADTFQRFPLYLQPEPKPFIKKEIVINPDRIKKLIKELDPKYRQQKLDELQKETQRLREIMDRGIQNCFLCSPDRPAPAWSSQP